MHFCGGQQRDICPKLDDFVQADASDGFILVPHITPGGLDLFADTVVPLLQAPTNSATADSAIKLGVC